MKDIIFLNIAEQISKLSICKRKQVGSIIVKNNIIISSGYNKNITNNCLCEDEFGNTLWSTFHSEFISIMECSKENLIGTTMYITLSPCKECAKLILQSGIKRIVMLNKHSCQEGIEFLKEQGIICEYISELINL